MTAHPVRVCNTFASALTTALGGTVMLRSRFPESKPLRVRKRRGRWVVYSSTGRILP